MELLDCQLCLHNFLSLGGKLPRDHILVRLKLVHNLSTESSRSNPSGINCLPSEVFPQDKCCSFAIVYGHQPIVHTWPEFDGLLVDRKQKLETCHSSASLVTLPVEVVDSGPEPGGRELVAVGIELNKFIFTLVNLTWCYLHSIRSNSDSFSDSLAFKSRMSLWREKETNSSHRGILTLPFSGVSTEQVLSFKFNFSQVQL